MAEWDESLELHLDSQLDHPIVREMEKIGGSLGITGHEGEQFLPPQGHTPLGRGDENLPTEIEGRVLQVDVQAQGTAAP